MLLTTVSNASELVGIIGVDDTWAWARNDQNLGALQKMIDDVSKLKTEFIKSWLTLEAHAIRNIFEPTVIVEQLGDAVPTLEKAARK